MKLQRECEADHALWHESRGLREAAPGTRGKRLVVLVGQKKAVAIAVRNASGRRRWSKLDEWLAGAEDGPQAGAAHDARALQEPPLTGAMPYG